MRAVLIAALALIVVPSAAAGVRPTAADRTAAARDCRSLRTSMGAATFARTFGTAQARRRNAFGRCVRQFTRKEHENRHEAVHACRAEREQLGGDAFRQKYGTRDGRRSAFAECVFARRRAESRRDRRSVLRAARTCKAERGEMGAEAFAAKYGANANDGNAFGKCVSTLARARDDE
ncbi:MAG: hypothetical protein M3312_07935 [Actinomycetota bacterium]|nr:hypothetical protein [Actinomycetota bacterium]